MHGHGTYTFANGTLHVGALRNGDFNGRGTRTWPNGNRYEGDWRDDKMHGRGTFTWADGNHYAGELRKGKFHGQGIFTWSNGDRYEGDWRDDKRNGRGTMIFANGSRREGEWRDGNYIEVSGPQRQRQIQKQNRAANAEVREQGRRNPSDPKAEERGLGLTLMMRRQIQSCLTGRGFNPGPSDGVLGPRSRGAIRAWQAARGQDQPQATGYLTEGDYRALLADCRVADQQVAEATSQAETRDSARDGGRTADYPGSIVISREPGDEWVGAIEWADTHEQARQKAMERCRNAQGTACKETARFSEPCGAIQRGIDGRFAFAGGVTAGNTGARANGQCEAVDDLCDGEVRCRVKLDGLILEEQMPLDYGKIEDGEAWRGSLAVSQDGVHAYAWAVAMDPDKQRASDTALEACKTAGGTDCRLARGFEQCLSLYLSVHESRTDILSAQGQNAKGAQETAAYECNGTGGHCVWLHTACTSQYPARVYASSAPRGIGAALGTYPAGERQRVQSGIRPDLSPAGPSAWSLSRIDGDLYVSAAIGRNAKEEVFCVQGEVAATREEADRGAKANCLALVFANPKDPVDDFQIVRSKRNVCLWAYFETGYDEPFKILKYQIIETGPDPGYSQCRQPEVPGTGPDRLASFHLIAGPPDAWIGPNRPNALNQLRSSSLPGCAEWKIQALLNSVNDSLCISYWNRRSNECHALLPNDDEANRCFEVATAGLDKCHEIHPQIHRPSKCRDAR